MPSDDRRRVLFVSTALSVGGAERFVATVLQHLDQARFTPHLALLHRHPADPAPEGVAVATLGKQHAWQIPAAIVRLARLVDALRPHAVMSAFAHPNWITGCALAVARHRPGWIARVSSPPALTDPGWLRPAMRHFYARADRVVANAEALAELTERVYPQAGAVTYLPNATDFDRIDALAAEPVPSRPPGRHRVLAAGRLVPEKRFDLLLEAAAHLSGSVDLEVVICGEGRERPRLETQARELGLEKRVRLCGFVENPWAWMASADAFALTSDMEGLPNALIEAQGLGLAAVATDCPTGPAEVIATGETGLLVPPGDSAALATALGALLADTAARRAMGAAGRERARARYAAPAATKTLEDLLVAVSRPLPE